MAQASLLIHEVYNLKAFAPIVMLVLIIVILWLTFRVQLFYAALMAVTGYLAYILFQTVLVLIFQLMFSYDEIIAETNITRMLQLCTSLLMIVVARILYLKRIGFSFVPDSERERIKLMGLNIVFLVILLVASIALAILYLYAMSGLPQLITTAVVLAVILAFFFYLAIRKERDQ
jgi:hypothetical protein